MHMRKRGQVHIAQTKVYQLLSTEFMDYFIEISELHGNAQKEQPRVVIISIS